MADAGDLKSLSRTGVPVRVREGLPRKTCRFGAAQSRFKRVERFDLGSPADLEVVLTPALLELLKQCFQVRAQLLEVVGPKG